MQNQIKYVISPNTEDIIQENVDHNVNCDPFFKKNLETVLSWDFEHDIIIQWIDNHPEKAHKILERCMETGHFYHCHLHFLHKMKIDKEKYGHHFIERYIEYVPIDKRLRFVEWMTEYEKIPTYMSYQEKGDWSFVVNMDIVKFLYKKNHLELKTLLKKVLHEKQNMKRDKYLEFISFYLGTYDVKIEKDTLKYKNVLNQVECVLSIDDKLSNVHKKSLIQYLEFFQKDCDKNIEHLMKMQSEKCVSAEYSRQTRQVRLVQKDSPDIVLINVELRDFLKVTTDYANDQIAISVSN